MIEISVVIPVYNSEENLNELNRQIQKELSNIPFEIVMVNDQSSDQSWNTIAKLSESYKNITGICLRKNSGQDNAIFAGLSYAKGNYVVIMDDDLQHSPADILRLYSSVVDGYDVCYANFETKKQAWWKNAGSWITGKIAEIVIGKPRDIYLSPFKIIKKDVIDEIKKTNYLYPYIDGLIFTITNNITQVKTEHHMRYSGKSNYNLWNSIKVFMKLLTGFSLFPLRLSSYLGMFSSGVGFVLGFYFILLYFINNDSPEGWTSLIVISLVIGGVILMSLGMIGEYLGRIYLTVNKQRTYSVLEELNNDKTS